MMTDRLRIGVCCDSEVLPFWISRLIDEIKDASYAELKLVILNKDQRIAAKLRPMIRLHEKIDGIVFRNSFSYNKKVDLSSLYLGASKVRMLSLEEFNEEAKGSIQNSMHNPQSSIDVLLNFCKSNISKTVLHNVRYGCWTFRIGNAAYSENSPDVYWQVVNKLPDICTSIRQLDSNGQSRIIYQTRIARYSNSLHINRDQAYELARILLARILKGIYQDGTVYLESLLTKYNFKYESPNEKHLSFPDSLTVIGNLVQLTFRMLPVILKIRNMAYWYLFIKPGPITQALSPELKKFRKVTAPRNHFWADPFVITEQGKHFVFVEEVNFKVKKKGWISVLEFDRDGKMIRANKVLEKPYHLSYPHIIRNEDTFFMIPESSRNKTLEIYRCVGFPDKWEFVMNLMEDISMKDVTLFYHNKKWWMFAAISISSDMPNQDELHLFHSNELLSADWTAHPANPVVTDIRSARPAGQIFYSDEKIYRPSQDSTGQYGRAFNICEITTLNEDEYEEILINKFEADWTRKLKGTHTFNFDTDFMVCDAFKFKKRYFSSLSKMLD